MARVLTTSLLSTMKAYRVPSSGALGTWNGGLAKEGCLGRLEGNHTHGEHILRGCGAAQSVKIQMQSPSAAPKAELGASTKSLGTADYAACPGAMDFPLWKNKALQITK